jgi:flagellar protein FlbD
MIMLHRLGHKTEPFYLTPDLIVTVEASPDTVITLTTGAKLVVLESPEEIVGLVQGSRVNVLVDALEARERERSAEAYPSSPPSASAQLTPSGEGAAAVAA